jgi:16S rRNA (adenine1518-N6/adenine1519-N6)-dimethyltransferase
MSLAHPRELFAFLSQMDISPKKGLSQNFLVDANIIRKIVASAGISPNDRVLEIGSGPGALTQELLQAGATVISIEKDWTLARALSRLQVENRLQIYEDDFLQFPVEERLKHFAPLKVVANLPYHIGTPIIERLCERGHLFSSAHIMVQKEVADRMVAKSGTKAISSFTIFLQMYCHPSIAMKVSRSCFYPAPQVDSCVVRLDFRSPPIQDPKPVLAMIRRAFQQRRKMLRSTLSIQQEPYASLRPEALSLKDWLKVYLFFKKDDSTSL